MIKSIYKIIKPLDPMTIYVGSTKSELKVRMYNHKWQKKRLPNTVKSKWLDDTCKIELIELREIPGVERKTRKDFEAIEFEWIARLRFAGYNIINFKDGRSKTDSYKKAISIKNNKKFNAINKESGYTKIKSDKRNAEKHPDYNKWCFKISWNAKRLGLTSKEYKLQYNISEYLGLKKIQK